MRKTTIGLCMIVKDESHVIERCLTSLKQLIDHWTIVDTGSTDDTMEKIRRILAGIPGTLHQRPWRNFGHNRSEALALARPHADYSFVIDADERLELPDGFGWPALGADDYRLLHATGSNRYWRTSLVSNRLAWRYVGVLHEYIEADGWRASQNLQGPVVWGYFDGGRSVGLSTIEKYARDARTLEAALVEEPHNARYQFYLAQGYRDSQQIDKAIAAYEARAAMGGWEEEVWYSLQQVAVMRERTGAPMDTVVGSYLRAFGARPQRAESLCSLAAYLRGRGNWALAHLFASRQGHPQARRPALPRPRHLCLARARRIRHRGLLGGGPARLGGRLPQAARLAGDARLRAAPDHAEPRLRGGRRRRGELSPPAAAPGQPGGT